MKKPEIKQKPKSPVPQAAPAPVAKKPESSPKPSSPAPAPAQKQVKKPEI